MAQIKLSKAQQVQLDKMRAEYSKELSRELEYYSKGPKNERLVEHYKECLEMVKKGFVLWYSPNSKTLEKLAALGYIEYVPKANRNFGSPIDWIKLL